MLDEENKKLIKSTQRTTEFLTLASHIHLHAQTLCYTQIYITTPSSSVLLFLSKYLIDESYLVTSKWHRHLILFS